jgi:hypothetical protein
MFKYGYFVISPYLLILTQELSTLTSLKNRNLMEDYLLTSSKMLKDLSTRQLFYMYMGVGSYLCHQVLIRPILESGLTQLEFRYSLLIIDLHQQMLFPPP